MNNGFSIEIVNRQTTLAVDPLRLTRAIEDVLRESGIETAEVSLAVVDDQEMHTLNRDFLNHDYPTDVLSFPLHQAEPTHAKATSLTPDIVGEIIVSADTAVRQAGEHGLVAEDELLLYVIHGSLHLIGFDDKAEQDRAVMRERESHFMKLSSVDLPRKIHLT